MREKPTIAEFQKALEDLVGEYIEDVDIDLLIGIMEATKLKVFGANNYSTVKEMFKNEIKANESKKS